MIEFLSGAVTLGFLVAAGFFLRFWRKTADRLFLALAAAFVLFALNQGLAAGLTVVLEPASLIYLSFRAWRVYSSVRERRCFSIHPSPLPASSGS